MRKFVLAAMAASVAMTGCTTNPYTGQSQVSKTAYGTGIGAAVGCGIGALVVRNGGCGKGAMIGGALGAGGGAYMDHQASELRQQLQGAGVSVQTDPQTGAINLVMPGNITFATGQSDINAGFYQTLNAVAVVLNKYNNTTIAVSGFTDNTGSASLNQQLSQARASSVANYLASQGVAGSRLSAQGYGSANPIADNSTKAGQAQNRRVEVRILPAQQ